MDPVALGAPVRAAGREVDSTLLFFNLRTMDGVFDRTVATQRPALRLPGVFAGLALVLAGRRVRSVRPSASCLHAKAIPIARR